MRQDKLTIEARQCILHISYSRFVLCRKWLSSGDNPQASYGAIRVTVTHFKQMKLSVFHLQEAAMWNAFGTPRTL